MLTYMFYILMAFRYMMFYDVARRIKNAFRQILMRKKESAGIMRSVHKTVTQKEHCRRRTGMVKNREV